MEEMSPKDLLRYQRQWLFDELGKEGQRRLNASRVLIVGVGGLGSWAADLLARAGVGFLRLADDDKVELTNIHRQSFYDECDAAAGTPKVEAAARRIRRINSTVTVEPVVARVGAGNIEGLCRDVQLILDGTDNFPTRFIINDFAVKSALPWVFAGVVRAEGQVMAILPGKTPCLRCVYDAPPPPCADPSCRAAGVLGPAVATIAAIQAVEVLKILSGRTDAVSPYLLRLDLWTNQMQRIDLSSGPRKDCPCCQKGVFDFIEGQGTI